MLNENLNDLSNGISDRGSGILSEDILSVGVIISTPAPSNDTKRADEMIATMTIDRAFETGIT